MSAIDVKFSFFAFDEAPEHNRGARCLLFKSSDVISFQIVLPAGWQLNSLAFNDEQIEYISASSAGRIRITTDDPLPVGAGRLVLLFEDNLDVERVFVSQPIEVRTIVDERFYSLVKYSHIESAFDFVYEEYWFNQLRLPLYVLNPQPKNKREVYRTTLGKYKNISAIQELEYDLRAMGNEELHQRIGVMLLHESIEIESKSYSCQEEYEVVYGSSFDKQERALIGTTKILQNDYLVQAPNWT